MESSGISKLASLIRQAKENQGRPPLPEISHSRSTPERETRDKKKQDKKGRIKIADELPQYSNEYFTEDITGNWIGDEDDDLLSDLSCDNDNQSMEGNNEEGPSGRGEGRGRPTKDSSGRGVSVYSDSRNDRTIFVGNSPASLTKKNLLKMFSVYGCVETVRMRSAAVSPGKLPVKVARRLKKQLVSGATVNWYVVMATVDEAKQCLELNGTEVDGRHLRVDMATPTKDFRRTVFVGNLPFSADEEKLREVFSHCGEIESIRIVKDNRTGFGKGIAYVMFKDSSGVLFAIKQDEKLELGGRKLRISRCKSKTGKEGEIERKEKKMLSLHGGLKAKKKKVGTSTTSVKRKGMMKKQGKKTSGDRRGRGTKNTWRDKKKNIKKK